MAIETELKLRVASQVDTDSWLVPLLGEAASRHLKNTYFDTADGLLAGWRMGLRIREVDGQREQTLKLAGNSGSALSARPEYNLPIDGDKPDLHAFPAEVWPQGTDLNALAQALVPVFSTDFARQKTLVASGQVEFCWDQGEVCAGERCLPIRELELEMQGEDLKALFDFASGLLRDGVQCFGLSKAARGNWLAKGQGSLDMDAPVPAVDRQMSNDDVLQQALACAISQWQQAEDAFLLQPGWQALLAISEALQYLRQVLSLFGGLVPRKASSELRQECQWLADQLAQAQAQVRIAKVLGSKGSGFRKLSISDELLEQANARQQALPNLAFFTQLLAGERANRLKLSALKFVALKEWRVKLDASALAELDKPIKWFADTHLAKAFADIKRHLTRGMSLAQYVDQEGRVLRYLTCCRTFAGLYQDGLAMAALELWQDFLFGLEEARRLEGLGQLAGRLDLSDEDEEQLEAWLNRKRQSLVVAMDQSRQLGLDQPIYWP
ncbi:MAG: CYTH domain-containing protein [Pseudomonadota bacterium]|uniref:CYTH domain-containing protein n=1 Tax=Gallaecimonas pentaromativorans TaxID=584787 RepID=UPI00067F22A9|nr:CYTH domain-containing protein [Gallaecimonas pentaromativorans]MED5524751.1 CYTH domain-containing protein [Pseudomonadota bacterium]